MNHPFLSVRALSKTYVSRRLWGSRGPGVPALNAVSFDLEKGRTLGVVGPSGSGKSTLARCLAGVERPDSGEILIEGRAPIRAEVQLIFQQPASSLNPRFTAGEIVAEPLLIQNRGDAKSRLQAAARWMEAVALPAGATARPALEFSGGERQRLAFARALATEPKVLILDESFAGLDLSVQLQISKLLADLQVRLELTCILIAHELSLVMELAHEIAVMQNGSIVERDPTAEILERPRHPLTRELIAASQAFQV